MGERLLLSIGGGNQPSLVQLWCISELLCVALKDGSHCLMVMTPRGVIAHAGLPEKALTKPV